VDGKYVAVERDMLHVCVQYGYGRAISWILQALLFLGFSED